MTLRFDLPQANPALHAAAPTALPSRTIPVEYVVKLFTRDGAPTARGSSFWMPLLLALFAGQGLLGFGLAGEYAWAGLCMAAMLCAGPMLWQAGQLEQARTALAYSQLDNSYIGALCEALEWPDPRVKHIAAMLLTQMLPRLKSGDSDLLAKEQRNCLYRRLAQQAARRNPELAIAILRALPVFGAEGALPYVARLANANPFTQSGREVKAAARHVLPGLEQLVAAQREAEEARLAAHAAMAAEEEEELTESEREQRANMAAHVDWQIKEVEEDLRKLRRPGMRFGFLLASWGIIVPYTGVQTYAHLIDGDLPIGLLFGLLTVLGTQLYRLTLFGKHKALAKRLSQMDDVRFIGRLSELLGWPDADVQTLAIAALTRLLRRVKASDKVLHTAAQRANLYRYLTLSHAGQYSDFLISTLKALEQVGDAAAVPYVVELANAQPNTAREQRVCDAAIDCLPYLQQRAKMSESSNILLRASSAGTTGPDDLVRAASPATATDPGQLLRANQGGGNER